FETFPLLPFASSRLYSSIFRVFTIAPLSLLFTFQIETNFQRNSPLRLLLFKSKLFSFSLRENPI
ncbi:unnamed protein product, partial [Arabidopsis halleri]